MASHRSLLLLLAFTIGVLCLALGKQVDRDITFDEPVNHEASATLGRRSAVPDSSLSGFASSILRRVRRAWFFGSSAEDDATTVTATDEPASTTTHSSPPQYTTRRYSRESDDYDFQASGDGMGDDEDQEDVSSTTHSGAGHPMFEGDRKHPHVTGGLGRPFKTDHELPPVGSSPMFRSSVLILNQPFDGNLAHQDSDTFKQLSAEFKAVLSQALAQYLRPPHNAASVEVLRFAPAARPGAMTVTCDIKLPHADPRELQRAIRSVLDSGRLGRFQLSGPESSFSQLGGES